MSQKLDEIMTELIDDYVSGNLTGVSFVESTKGGEVKYRYSSYVTSNPAHFIGYLTAMCSELAGILGTKQN